MMTLGPLVYEAHARVIEMKRLPNGNIESTVALKGLFLGEGFSGTCVGKEELRKDSTSQVKVDGFLTTESGTTISTIGIDTGMGRGDHHIIFKGSICLSCPPSDFSRFDGVTVVWEVEIDEDATFHTSGWELK